MGFHVENNAQLKKIQKIIYNKMTDKENYPKLLFNSCQVSMSDSQNHLGFILYSTIILFNQVCNDLFHQKVEAIQYNAPLAITGAIEVHLKKIPPTARP